MLRISGLSKSNHLNKIIIDVITAEMKIIKMFYSFKDLLQYFVQNQICDNFRFFFIIIIFIFFSSSFHYFVIFLSSLLIHIFIFFFGLGLSKLFKHLYPQFDDNFSFFCLQHKSKNYWAKNVIQNNLTFDWPFLIVSHWFDSDFAFTSNNMMNH